MIRPITCICFLLACGSGLYLYQAKHRVEVLDHQIQKTVHDTDAIREQTRVLHAEWTLLNDPERLQALADQFLTLKTVAPGQFTSMAELDSRLPTVPPPPAATPVPVAELPAAAPSEPSQPPAAPTQVATKPEQLPQRQPVAATQSPPKPMALAAVVPPQQRIPDRRPPPHPVPAEVAPVRSAPTPPTPHPVLTAELRRPTPPRVVPAALPVQAPLPVISGSSLGMARSAPPPPQPMPYVFSPGLTSGGGG